MGKSNISVKGHIGTWYEIDSAQRGGKTLFLMENEFYGDEAHCVIIDNNNTLIMEDVVDGFEEYDEAIENGSPLIY